MPQKRPRGCAAPEKRLIGLVEPKHRRDVKRALEVMYRAHNGQKRKEGKPYATHPLAVALIAIEEAGLADRDAVIAALLHDVLEDDMATTPEELTKKFGKAAAGAVVTLTKMYKRDGTPKEEGLRRYYAGLQAAPDWVKTIKLCGRLHNTRSLAASNPTPERVTEYAKETRENLLPLADGARHAGLATAAALISAELASS